LQHTHQLLNTIEKYDKKNFFKQAATTYSKKYGLVIRLHGTIAAQAAFRPF
jgi:hypothetical protein